MNENCRQPRPHGDTGFLVGLVLGLLAGFVATASAVVVWGLAVGGRWP